MALHVSYIYMMLAAAVFHTMRFYRIIKKIHVDIKTVISNKKKKNEVSSSQHGKWSNRW